MATNSVCVGIVHQFHVVMDVSISIRILNQSSGDIPVGEIHILPIQPDNINS